MGDFHIKKIILPSGKAVEIVYYDADGHRNDAVDRAVQDALQPRRVARRAEATVALEVCPCCGSDLVYPVDWREAESDRWELELRCPGCEWHGTGLHDQATVERFDEVLNASTDLVIETLEHVSRQNMAEEIERFVEALDRGHIMPFDF